MKANQYQTLHGHTIASDGKLSHLEVLDVCQKYNVGVYAFTDHDSLPSEKVVQTLQQNKNHPTKWIIGIEISSEVHLTGLFVDPFNKELVEHCQKAQVARVERMERMVENLRLLGFEITAEDCLRASKGESVGSPHIVEALKSKEGNLQIIEALRKKMENDAQSNPQVKEKYETMMAAGERQYPYQLFLTNDAYLKGVYVDYTYRVDLDTSVKLIRNAGGLAFLAHWFTYKQKYPASVVENLLSQNRLDGLEVVYGIGAGGVIEEKSLEEDVSILDPMLQKYNKLRGGGFDAHSEADFKLFVENQWYAQKTTKLVEKMIVESGVDTTWSSLQ